MSVIGFNIWCSVPSFIKIGRFFTKIWWFNHFQNGGLPPSWIFKNLQFLSCSPCRHAVLLPHIKFRWNRTIGRWIRLWPKKRFSRWRPPPSWILKILILGHAAVIGFNIWCCIPSFNKIGQFFTEIWRFNDFQNGGRPPSWILKIYSFCHAARIDMQFWFLTQNFTEIGQSIDEFMNFMDMLRRLISCRIIIIINYGQKTDFKDGGRRHLEFSKFQFLVTWLSSGSLSAVVYQILSKSDDFSLRYGDLAMFKMAAVRHLGFVMTSQYCIAGHIFVVLKFLVDRWCSFRDTCYIVRQPFGCT